MPGQCVHVLGKIRHRHPRRIMFFANVFVGVILCRGSEVNGVPWAHDEGGNVLRRLKKDDTLTVTILEPRGCSITKRSLISPWPRSSTKKRPLASAPTPAHWGGSETSTARQREWEDKPATSRGLSTELLTNRAREKIGPSRILINHSIENLEQGLTVGFCLIVPLRIIRIRIYMIDAIIIKHFLYMCVTLYHRRLLEVEKSDSKNSRNTANTFWSSSRGHRGKWRLWTPHFVQLFEFTFL